MAGAPTKDTSTHRRLAALERQTNFLWRALERQTHRSFAAGWPRDVRIVHTVAHDADSPTYPIWPCNTYRAESIDSHYEATPGQRSPTDKPRGEKIVIHDRFGGYLFQGDEVIVARIRGLGDYTDGEWFVIGAERTLYKGKALADIPPGGSGAAEIWNRDGAEVMPIVAYFNHLEGTSPEIPADTDIGVEWLRDEQKWIIFHAAC